MRPACLLAAALLAVAPLSAFRRSSRAHRYSRAPVSAPVAFDAGVINDPNLNEPVGPGDRGSAVVRAQILLDRAHFSCGQIDGQYGNNLTKTVAAYQNSHGIPASGTVDAQTWAALNGDQAPALFTYTIAPEDVAGPFVTLPPSIMQQAKLPALGYASPADGLGEKFHASPGLLAALNPGKDLAAGEQILAPNVIVTPPGKAASVVVSKSDSSVTAYDAQGRILSYYAATIGSEHDPLPVGQWKILGVQRNPVFHYNPALFWNADPKDSKAIVPPGPRNPVGVVWIALSKAHYGIHGTPQPAKIGHTESHGCIRLTNWDASELASIVKPGTPAILKE